jgi:predicted ABC-type ATPase
MKDWLASQRIRDEGLATESNLVSNHDFNLLETAKTTGMKTELYFVGLPLETALLRESIRSDNNEQEKIKAEDIIQRYQKGLPNIQKHIESENVDVVMVYDNSRGRGEEQLLLHIGNGKPFFIHKDLPEWFKEANVVTPEMERKYAEYQSTSLK